VRAEDAVEEDIVEGEEDADVDEGDATVETDEGEAGDGGAVYSDGEAAEEEEEEQSLKPSPDADTYLLFTKPLNMGMLFSMLMTSLISN
jgi:translocon-associated protein subunit alpha